MKKILIIICLLFLTGCNVSYEITLKNNEIKERLTIIESNQELFDLENDSGMTLREIFKTLVDEENDGFSVQDYSIKSLNSNSQLGVEYASDSSQSLINSAAINQCYTNPILKIEENVVTFNTGSEFTCYDYYENLETISIVLITNHKVISSNAEIVDDNKYIWNITKDGNKDIEIVYQQSDSNSSLFVTIIVSVIFAIIIFSVLFYINIKKKRENKI